jgi:orotate phosphoribosyltransferase
MKSKRAQLLNLIKRKALKFGTITLSSGKKSDWYVDLRLITLDPEGSYLVSELLFELLKNEKIDALGGLTLGADPICGAFAATSFRHNNPISTFIVRKEPKKHGRMRRIEGHLKKGSKVAIVDDVATTGSSLLKTIEVVREEGCKVVKVITIVDREEGAKEKLAEKGYPLISLFSKKDFLEK